MRGVMKTQRRREEALEAALQAKLEPYSTSHLSYFKWDNVAQRCRIPPKELTAVLSLIYG